MWIISSHSNVSLQGSKEFKLIGAKRAHFELNEPNMNKRSLNNFEHKLNSNKQNFKKAKQEQQSTRSSSACLHP